jgi:CHAD domain-containing protein
MGTRHSAVSQTVGLLGLLGRLAAAVKTAARTPDADAIHHLRVAIRRFAQAVAAFRSCFPKKETRRIRRSLKSMLALAGAVRDCDIALEILAGEGESELAARVSAQREQAERALLAALKQWVARKSAVRWRQALQTGSAAAPVEDLAQDELRRLARPFFREGGRAASEHATAGELHRVRIAAKKLRYTLELFLELCAPAAGDWLERIRGVQSLLGSINDCRAARALLSGLGGSPPVETALRRRQRRQTREFHSLWAKTFAGQTAREWVNSLRRPPRKSGVGTAAAPAAGQETA